MLTCSASWYGTLKAPVIEGLNAGKKVLLVTRLQFAENIQLIIIETGG